MLAIQEETYKTTTYPSYKPSQIDWIGDIPEHWDMKKLKYCLSEKLKYGANESSDEENPEFPRYIRITDFGDNGILRKDTFKSLAPEVAKDYLLSEGDVLFARSGATVGKTFLFTNYDGIACFAGYLIKASPNQNLLSEFLYYFTKTANYWNWVNSIFIQATIQNIGADKYQNIEFALPPLQEQQAIVTYLDQKTALIDELIAKKQRKIDLLKEQRTAIINHAVTKGLNPNVDLKDSGVEWIGEIPEHWGRKRIKQLSKIISKGTTPSTVSRELLEEGEIRYLKAENISDNKVVPFPSFFIDNETDSILSRSKLLENDILFVIAGATLGKVAILPKEFIPANTNQAVSFIRLKEGYNVNFAWYWLSSSILQEQIWIDAVQSAQPNLSMENLGNFHIPFPPLSEQQSIVAYLDEQTALLNNAISLEAQKIEKLKEYRQSLISAAVTGKICVLPVTENELSKAR